MKVLVPAGLRRHRLVEFIFLLIKLLQNFTVYSSKGMALERILLFTPAKEWH